jgi:hypothetical protein
MLYLMTSCESKSSKDKVENPNELSINAKSENETITGEYTYQGCEYIVVGNYYGKWGSHKGNCKNPIHECNCK